EPLKGRAGVAVAQAGSAPALRMEKAIKGRIPCFALPREGCDVFASPDDRAAVPVLQLRKDKTMFAFLFALAEVVQNAVANNPCAVARAGTAVAITGSALVALMRKHKIKNKELAEQLGISGKEVTQARKSGIDDPDQAARWQNAITSRPIPERRSRRRRHKNRQAEQQATDQGTAAGPETQSDPNYQPQTPLPQKLLLPANLAVLVKPAARE